MASLVDESYYKNVYKGADIDNLDVVLDRASDIVRQHTLYTIDKIDCLPFFMQENVKKAVCAEAEYIGNNGGLEALNMSNAASFSIGRFSMSAGGGGSGNSTSNTVPAAPLMLSYLESVGLLYRGGGAL